VPVATLNKPEPAVGDWFGWSIDHFRTRVVVGAQHDDTGAINAGSAYVYDLASATPTVPTVILNNPSPAADDNFGYSVSISGTRVAVGALNHNTELENAGSAYVYDLASTTPTVPLLALDNPKPYIANEQFGESVAISGPWVVVASYVGTIYAYNIDGASPTVPSYKFFGYAVSISGTRFVVGRNRWGSASVTIWQAVRRLWSWPHSMTRHVSHTTGTATPSPFSGDRAVVGAPYSNSEASWTGSAYVYDFVRHTGPMALNSPSLAISDNFGFFGSCVRHSGGNGGTLHRRRGDRLG